MLKLKDLKSLEIKKLNDTVGGNTDMGYDEMAMQTLSCYGNCHGSLNGGGTWTGDSMVISND